MKRIRTTYHLLNRLKAADPKLRKAIIVNRNQETMKSNYEFALNVLRGNIPRNACIKRKLQTYKNSLCKVADKSVSLSAEWKLKIQRCGFLLPMLSAILPTLAGLFSARITID